MLKEENRLKNRIAFQATYKQRQSFADDLLILYVGKPKENNENTKIGFVVSKKISKLAVIRNRIKRLVRESMRLYLKENREPDVISLIFMARENAAGKNFEEINNSVLNLLKKAHIKNN